jgi:hypothetical protein
MINRTDAKIESKNYYLAQEDQNLRDEPTIQIVAKDESHDFYFTKRHNFWVLTHHSQKLDYFSYQEVRELIAPL